MYLTNLPFIVNVSAQQSLVLTGLLRTVSINYCIVAIVKSRMKWAGNMVRMNDDKLPKRAQIKKQEGSRKRGRPQLRSEDCVKRDLRKAETM